MTHKTEWHLPKSDCDLPMGTKIGWWIGNEYGQVQLLERTKFQRIADENKGVVTSADPDPGAHLVVASDRYKNKSFFVNIVLLPPDASGWHTPPLWVECELPAGTKLRWYAPVSNCFIERELLEPVHCRGVSDRGWGEHVSVYRVDGQKLQYLEEGKPVPGGTYALSAHFVLLPVGESLSYSQDGERFVAINGNFVISQVLLPRQPVTDEGWHRPPGTGTGAPCELPVGTKLRDPGGDVELLAPALCYSHITHLQITGKEGAPLVYRRLGSGSAPNKYVTEALGTSLLVQDVLFPDSARSQRAPELPAPACDKYLEHYAAQASYLSIAPADLERVLHEHLGDPAATARLYRNLAAEQTASRPHPHEGRSDRVLKQTEPSWYRRST